MGQWKHFRWYTRPKCDSEPTLCCFLLQTDETEVLWAFPVKSCPLGLLMKGPPVGGRSEQPFDQSPLRIQDYLRWIQETFQWCLGCIGNRRPSGNNSQSALQSFSFATRENSIFPCWISSRPGSSSLWLNLMQLYFHLEMTGFLENFTLLSVYLPCGQKLWSELALTTQVFPFKGQQSSSIGMFWG